MASSDDQRWVEVSPSQFPHEREGLAEVRQLLPQQPPFRAWSNFEFRDNHGRWHEVDLLVLGRRRLHLVELKYYSGILRGDDHTWRRSGHRAEDSPLKLARRKAQYLASKLQDEFGAWVREKNVSNPPKTRDVVPWVQESIFLHHEQLVSELSDASAINLYGLDGHARTTHLPGISELLLEPADPDSKIHEDVIAQLMARIGLVHRREREVGSWVIQDEALAEGDGWQEWAASHRVSQQQQARIRFQMVNPGAPETERRRLLTLADHEYRMMSRLSHESILRPADILDDELGVGLVYPLDDDWRRLDLWLADQPEGIALETQLSIIRQVGEALQYAHANRVVHRGVNPHAIWVRQAGTDVKVQVREWQTVGSVTSKQDTTITGVTALVSVDDAAKTDAWLESFTAPEGALAGGADRIRVDVFGLGALAFYLLAGTPPAQSGTSLRTRLHDQQGLDLAPEVPEISSVLRSATLAATHPAVTERTASVADFLAELAHERAASSNSEAGEDPLDAAPGALIGGRFELIRRLGTGSTAVGLLVRDQQDETTPPKVLKVAVDDAAVERLRDEAEVLTSLSHQRFVKLLAGPIDIGGRWALLLERAGEQTLAQALNERTRLSLDLLERWGVDLLTALVQLDATGIDHRDIKPANLGVQEDSRRQKHLVLFDFSLSRAVASALGAGTPPYLDPFLGSGTRTRYDSAAERYAAAVVLFEMATGNTPVHGDGESDAAAISDEATVRADDFDPAVAQPMVTFFQQALARNTEQRHDTAAEMLTLWKQIFQQTETGIPDNAEELRNNAQPDTPLTEAGLSARSLSALEPYKVKTVGDLVAVDPARLSRLSGLAHATRTEIRKAANAWRSKFESMIRARAAPAPLRETVLSDPMTMAEQLLDVARTGRSTTRATLVSQILGITGTIDAFATQSQIAASVDVTPGRANQLITELQELWPGDDRTRDALTTLSEQIGQRLAALGGIATVGELVDHLISVMVENPESDDNQETRLTAGLVRIGVDRQRAIQRGGDEEAAEFVVRRSTGHPVLIASDPTLLDAVADLGSAADHLVSEFNPGDERGKLVPSERTATGLIDTLPETTLRSPLRDTSRLARLAAALSDHAAVSASQELHHRELPPAAAVSHALGAVPPDQGLPADEIRNRVRARFPALAALPKRPRLDHVVAESGLGLHYDHRVRKYMMPAAHHDTTGLDTRAPTSVVPELSSVSTRGVVGERLTQSLARRSFLALAPEATNTTKLIDILSREYGATVINVAQIMIDAMEERASAEGVPWATVLDADAQPDATRAAQGLAALVTRALPVLESAVDDALNQPADGPVVLTDVSLLARYGVVSRLSRWTDLASSKQRALWVVVPQLLASHGAVLDGKPLPLAAPGQLVAVDRDWVNSRASAHAEAEKEGATS